MITGAMKNNVGLQLLQWAVSQSDIWHLAHRCSELVQKINEPLEKSAYVLDNLLAMDEDDIHLHCGGMRDMHLNRMHFDDEDDYNGEQMQRFINQNNRNVLVPDAPAGILQFKIFYFYSIIIGTIFIGDQWWQWW